MADIEIGLGKSGRQGFSLDQISLVPSRRTRNPAMVDLSWQIDAYKFDLPFLSSPMDSVTNVNTAKEIGRLGGLGVLDLEGSGHDTKYLTTKWLSWQSLGDQAARTRLRELYDAPINPDLIIQHIKDLQDAGYYAAGKVSPKHAAGMADMLQKAWA